MIKWERMWYNVHYPCDGPVEYDYYPEGYLWGCLDGHRLITITHDVDYLVESNLFMRPCGFSTLGEAKDYAEKKVIKGIKKLYKGLNK